MRKLSGRDWIAFLMASALVLMLLARPAIYKLWHAEAQQQTDAGQQYQKIQTVILALSALASFLTIGAILFQAFIADKQAGLMEEQATISKRQALLEERRFVAENRPRLVVRELSGVYLMTVENAQAMSSNKGGNFIWFSVTNVGGTSCKVTESRAELLVLSKGFPQAQFARVSADFANGGIFPPGHIETRSVFAEGVQGQIDWSSSEAVLCGSIVYIDDNGTRRSTAFWRNYEGAQGFRRSQNQSVEYED